MPIWAFHGSDDQRVPVEQSRNMVAAIRQASGDIKYTEYPGGRHYIWDKVFDDHRFWQWLFAQERRPATKGPAQLSPPGDPQARDYPDS